MHRIFRDIALLPHGASLFHAAPFVAPAVELVKSPLVDCKYAADHVSSTTASAGIAAM
jgi:hypothetical protein